MNTHRQANPPVFTSKSTSSSKTNAFAPENSNIQELIESLQNNRVSVKAKFLFTITIFNFLTRSIQFNTTEYNVNKIAAKYFNGDFKKLNTFY